MLDKIINRQLVKLAHARSREEPVILLEGPRASGKSTTIRALADLFKVRVIDFDNQIIRDDAARDPGFYISNESIILIDEYQRVPAILDAIKTRLNLSGRPGQFILTGSTRHDAMTGSVQALTGRLHKIQLLPFAQSEIEGTVPDLLARLIENPAVAVGSERANLQNKSLSIPGNPI
jgi:predicted AAA+ superfamily ATPase